MACIYIENVPCYFDLQETVAYLRRYYSMGWPTGIWFYVTHASSARGQQKATIRFRELEDAHRLLDGDMYWPTAQRIIARIQKVDVLDCIMSDSPLPPSSYTRSPSPLAGRCFSKAKNSRAPPPLSPGGIHRN